LTAFGIAIGVFALTVLGAMSEYFNTMIDGAERLSLSTVDVMPAGRGADARLTTSTIQQLNRVSGVKGVANILTSPLNENAGMSMGVSETVWGMDPRHAPDLFQAVKLQSGRWIDEGDLRVTVVGSKLAAARKLGVGSTLTWRGNEYIVVGVMQETNTYPDGFAVMPFEVVRRELKYPATVIGLLKVLPLPGTDPEALAARITDEVARVKAKSPRQAMGEMRATMAIFTVIMLGGAVMAAIVGGLAVVNTMVMSVSERTREIGIKKALGAENGTIVREYLAESAMIGLVGGISGLWFGWVLATLMNKTIGSAMGGEIWHVTARLVVVVLAFALILGAGAGIYPAWFAARLRPVQALRAE
jgi:putative ABC transport system permease protein